MKTDTRQQQLLGQQLALSAYLDALLEAPAEPAPELETPGATPPATVVEVSPETMVAITRSHGVPDWAESRFQALLFEVAGLTLAVPLVKLKGVVPNEQGLTPMPGHSPLFLGVTPYQGLQSKVVDTARFVLPQDRAAQLSEDAGERCQHLVMIDDGRWALACSGIGDVVDLERDDVKWRSATGSRLWLAGTVIERMCALLDVEQLSRELAEGLG
jgi:purine-binding chemotaxis protein CheW